VDEDVNVIEFWEKYTDCKELREIALMYLTIPATSVPAEQVHSTAGNIITDKRNRLTAEMAEKLIFLRENLMTFKENRWMILGDLYDLYDLVDVQLVDTSSFCL
jgi:hypothetical protein